MKQTIRKDERRTYPVQALQRGLLILETVLEAGDPLSLDEIRARTGLPKATAFRLILNLVESEYMVETDQGYWLGLKLMRLGALVEKKLDLKQQALPHLENLLARFNETVHLGVLDGEMRVVYLEKLAPQRAVGLMGSRVGAAFPMHCTGLGKAMVAFHPEKEIRGWVRAHGLKRYTAATITNEAEFLEELRQIRSAGYSIDDGEHEEGVRCVAAPIRDKDDAIVAAVSIAGPDVRMPEPLSDSSMAEQVVETALHISLAHGYSSEEFGSLDRREKGGKV